MRTLEEVRGRRQPLLRLVRRLAWLALPIAVLGELGHHLLERLASEVAHHFFHIVFALGAVMVFGAYLAVQIRRDGWPSFSWRLRPDATTPSRRPR